MKVTYSREDGIGRITLANPPHNTLIHPVFADKEQWGAFLADPRLRGVVVCGGGRHFSAGADLQSLDAQRGHPAALAEALNQGDALLSALTFATVPVVAAVRGSCLGAGMEIALACHFRLAAKNSLLGFPESRHGVMPGFGGTALSAGVATRQAVVDLMLSGRMISAAEGLSMGLVDKVLPTQDLMHEAHDFLIALTRNRSTALIRAVMQSIHNGRRLPLEQALREETEIFAGLVRGGEHGEG